jgi:alpha,alpha-trehalase
MRLSFSMMDRHATGGSIPGLLPRLPDDQLNVTLSINNTGIVSLACFACYALFCHPCVFVNSPFLSLAQMFEKFSVQDVDAAGRGGEYTVQVCLPSLTSFFSFFLPPSSHLPLFSPFPRYQAGFGWTNGVALWVAGEYGQLLVAPDCPALLPVNSTTL